MRLAVTGGGTGGHVYPALAVVTALSHQIDGRNNIPSLLYVGTQEGMEAEIVARSGLPFVAISAAALRGRSTFQLFAGITKMFWGVGQSLSILADFRPQALLATGGYVCVPVALAAWLRRIPTLIYLPDIEPGWAVKFLGLLAKCIAVTSQNSQVFLPVGKVIETGYPLRPGFQNLDKPSARQRFSLAYNQKVLLIWGGSRGAHSINQAVSSILSPLLNLCQVIHISGSEDEPWLREIQAKLPAFLQKRYFLYPYLHEELPNALAAADLAISRAGAAIMGEFPAVGLPSILIPYPYAGGHQRHNADFMVKSGAAIRLEDSSLDALLPTIRQLLADEARLAHMSTQARSLAHPEAAQKIASLLEEMATSKRKTQ